MARSVRILALLVVLLFLLGTFHGVVHHPGGLDHGCVLCMNPVVGSSLPPLEQGLELRRPTSRVSPSCVREPASAPRAVRWSRGPPDLG